jgi:hypothetical protein
LAGGSDISAGDGSVLASTTTVGGSAARRRRSMVRKIKGPKSDVNNKKMPENRPPARARGLRQVDEVGIAVLVKVRIEDKVSGFCKP